MNQGNVLRIVLALSLALAPLAAAPDSALQTGAGDRALRASARVDVKIVIPSTLGLDVSRGQDQVAVYANNRTVALGGAAQGPVEKRSAFILNSGARRIISQSASCTSAQRPTSIVCTASTP
jgi:hypothetical protein